MDIKEESEYELDETVKSDTKSVGFKTGVRNVANDVKQFQVFDGSSGADAPQAIVDQNQGNYSYLTEMHSEIAEAKSMDDLDIDKLFKDKRIKGAFEDDTRKIVVKKKDNGNIAVSTAGTVQGSGRMSGNSSGIQTAKRLADHFDGEAFDVHRRKKLDTISESYSNHDIEEDKSNIEVNQAKGRKQQVFTDGDTTVVTKDTPEERHLANGIVKVNDETYLNYRRGKQWQGSKSPRIMAKNDDLADELDVDDIDEAMDELQHMSDEEVEDLDSAFYNHNDRDTFEVDKSDWLQYKDVMKDQERADNEDREIKPEKLPEKLDPLLDKYNIPHTESVHLGEITEGEGVDIPDAVSKEDVIKHRFSAFGGVLQDEEIEQIVDEFDDSMTVEEIADIIGDDIITNRKDKEKFARRMRPYLVAVEKRWGDTEQMNFEDDIENIPVLGLNGSVYKNANQPCGKACEGCPHGTYAQIKYRDANGNSTSKYAGKTDIAR